MNYFKELSHVGKVILSTVGSAIVVLCSDPGMLTALIAGPLSASLPAILPKLVAAGALGGSLYNMSPKKDAGN